jgi:hypothetical protein
MRGTAMPKLELSQQEQERVLSAVAKVEKAAKALPPEERKEYEAAQQSVVDARRSAESHGNKIQLC